MKNIHLLTWLLLAFALLPSALLAQQAPITGVVTDATSQEALIGVTVLVKGNTSLNAQTGLDGRYAIQAPADAVLTFNYVGYAQQEIPVAGKTAVNVAMQSTTKLNEVVVVGYGTQKKRDLTGAVARVEGSEIVNQPVQTPTQALQGKLAGVQIISDGTPNSQPTVRIRGTGTLLAGANPLYVVDGVQTTDIRNLSNADIASIDVLKDASAAAIYGVRGANGVIIVTTKKGAVGKPVLSYSGTYGFKEAAHIVQMANADEYRKYITDTAPGTTFPSYPGFGAATTNWYKEILKHGIFQNHNLAVSGATDNVRYYFSGNLLQDDGIVTQNKFQRLTVRSNTSFSLSDKVTISSQASFSPRQYAGREPGRGLPRCLPRGPDYSGQARAALRQHGRLRQRGQPGARHRQKQQPLARKPLAGQRGRGRAARGMAHAALGHQRGPELQQSHDL